MSVQDQGRNVDESILADQQPLPGNDATSHSTSGGGKVTKDPEAFNNPKNENPGMVTSDSLAAESIQSGGSFGANSDARGPMNQPSSSTNTNTTDTSGATTLPPAPDAESREAQQGWSEESQLNAGRELGSGGGPTYSAQASGGSSGGNSGGSGGSYSAAAGGSENTQPGAGGPGYGSGGQGDKAPSYHDHPAPSMGDDFKPKGKNIQEGGEISGDEPNASFDTDIGGKNDPGRAALGAMEARDARGAGGEGPRQYGKAGDEGQYGNLDETSA